MVAVKYLLNTSSPYNNTQMAYNLLSWVYADSQWLSSDHFIPPSLEHQSHRTHTHTKHYDMQKAQMWENQKKESLLLSTDSKDMHRGLCGWHQTYTARV